MSKYTVLDIEKAAQMSDVPAEMMKRITLHLVHDVPKIDGMNGYELTRVDDQTELKDIPSDDLVQLMKEAYRLIADIGIVLRDRVGGVAVQRKVAKIKETRQEMIRQALANNGGNKSAAAKELGMSVRAVRWATNTGKDSGLYQ